MGQTTDISSNAINGGGSRLIASLENINLNVIAENVLNWVSGKNASNTAPTNIVIKFVSGTHSVNDAEIKLGAFTLLFGGGYSVTQFLQSLNNNSVISLATANDNYLPFYSKSGNWSIPISGIPTSGNFIISVFVFGETI
jgi:hypothetical protein